MTFVTEEQARGRTCPLIRYCENGSHVFQDHGSAIYEHSICLSSNCMAWRWRNERDGQHRVGYCGQFGKPEV